MGSTPQTLYDTIIATDTTGAFATSQLLVGNPLLLFCDIIQNQMGLANGRVYLWDQKIMQPTDSGLYVAVSTPSIKAFGNNLYADGSGSGLNADQSVNVMATMDIDIISRSSIARDQKKMVLLALYSIYSQQQQEYNSFSIGRLPVGGRFLNSSMVTVPRFRIGTKSACRCNIS